MNSAIKYFSMFTGIGGFELGIERAALSVWDRQTENTESSTLEQSVESATKSLQSNGHSTDTKFGGNTGQILCVGYSEIDKYAIQTFETNFGKGIKNYGDATKINTAELPDFDLLVGGFPCQAFSIAGKRAGFEDTRGTLIFDVVRVLRDKRPRHFVLENVKGLLSHEGGKTFAAILEILTDTGYDVSWSIHNSKNYGVPQNRERVYLIGNLRGETRPQVFPLRASGEEAQGTSHPTIDANYYKGLDNHGQRTAVMSIDRKSIHSSTRRGVVKTERVGTLDTDQQQFVTDGVRIRRLTPRECERLQGFPDNWTIGSDTQRYKQCGNAITVNVVQHVIGEIYGLFTQL